MSWFSKMARDWGQIPFSNPAAEWDNPYSRDNPDNPRAKKKKDWTQESLGLGSDTHSTTEMSGQGTNPKQPNSLTSGNEVDSQLYDGEIMDEGVGGKVFPRTTETGGPSVGDGASVLGVENDGYGAYVLRNSPGDATVKERQIDNLLRFQKKPSRTVNINNQRVNVI